ncbi:hypothetical protein GCM10027395_14520 [Giesbergeria sinuosa]
MVAVDMQIALTLDVKINQAVAGDLFEHVIKKTNAAVQLRLACAVQIEAHSDLGFQRMAGNVGLTHVVGHSFKGGGKLGMIASSASAAAPVSVCCNAAAHPWEATA